MEEEIVMDGVVSSEQPYDKISKLNASLDSLVNEVNGINLDVISQNEEPEMPSVSNSEIEMPSVSSIEANNEIEMPSVSSVEVNNDLTNEEAKEQAALVKEITTDEEDATNEPSSKGQFILIGILSLVLIALLIAMVVFTNAL